MNKSTEIGLQDLLFNGAIACLLLFIIFAIKANGFAVISALSGNNDLGKYQSNSSLPIKGDALDGKMISYRKVLIKGLGSAYHKSLLNQEVWKWEITNGEIEESIEFIGDDVVLIASFTNHPSKLKLNLSINSPKKHIIKVSFIEGANKIESRMGNNEGTCSINKGSYRLSNINISFLLDSDFQSDGICNDNIVKVN